MQKRDILFWATLWLVPLALVIFLFLDAAGRQALIGLLGQLWPVLAALIAAVGGNLIAEKMQDDGKKGKR